MAGSTWPRDEECIYPVLRKALEQSPELQLVLVPHEPTEEHLLHAETFFQGIPMVRWKNRDQAPSGLRIVLIDTIGLLAGLYRGADIAYVGAGFTTGVHNTMEPASMGLPVFFGPRYANALDAQHTPHLHAYSGYAYQFPPSNSDVVALVVVLLPCPVGSYASDVVYSLQSFHNIVVAVVVIDGAMVYPNYCRLAPSHIRNRKNHR